MPLRWKLVAVFAVILAIVLGTFSVALPPAFRRILLQGVDGKLTEHARTIGAITERERGNWFLEDQSGIHESFAAGSGLFYIVTDDHGATLASSALARTLGVSGGTTAGAMDRRIGERHFREVTILVHRVDDEEEEEGEAEGSDSGTKVRTLLYVTCGQDLKQVDLSVASLTRSLWIGVPLILLASLAGGLFLARRALRPIDAMVATAAKISADDDLSRRIEVRGRDELARLAETLNGMFGRLQGAFERQTHFTADASHELRTPLTVIAGNVDLGLRRPRTPDEYRDILEEIRKATHQMESLVRSLLTLARADEKGDSEAREPVSLVRECDEVIRMQAPLAERREVEVSRPEVGEDVIVNGDAERLRELLSNLLSNAIRYNRRGGRVDVQISRIDGKAIIAVEDTGIGIPPEDLPHIFERFYRVDKARSREAGGSGLGLSIAKAVVDAHGGSIAAASSPAGTRVTVTLPLDGN